MEQDIFWTVESEWSCPDFLHGKKYYAQIGKFLTFDDAVIKYNEHHNGNILLSDDATKGSYSKLSIVKHVDTMEEIESITEQK
jgi:hypothetical protein